MENEKEIPDFEEFRGSGSRMETYYIGITKSGTISIYSGFYQDEEIEKHNYVLLMYSKENKIIGLRFSEKDDLGKGVCKVNKQGGKNNAWISAGNFFKHYKLDTEKLKGRYEPTTYEIPEKGKVYGVDISQKV